MLGQIITLCLIRLNLMKMTKQRLSNIKCAWKKQVQAISLRALYIDNKAKAGDIITIGEVYSVAHKLRELGEKSVELARDMALAGMSSNVLLEIGILSHALEQHSVRLRTILEKRNLMLSSYPTWY